MFAYNHSEKEAEGSKDKEKTFRGFWQKSLQWKTIGPGLPLYILNSMYLYIIYLIQFISLYNLLLLYVYIYIYLLFVYIYIFSKWILS